VEFTSLEDVRSAEKKAYEDGLGSATAYTLRRIWAEGKTLYDQRDNGVLGADGEKTEDLQRAVIKAIEAQDNA